MGHDSVFKLEIRLGMRIHNWAKVRANFFLPPASAKLKATWPVTLAGLEA